MRNKAYIKKLKRAKQRARQRYLEAPCLLHRHNARVAALKYELAVLGRGDRQLFGPRLLWIKRELKITRWLIKTIEDDQKRLGFAFGLYFDAPKTSAEREAERLKAITYEEE